MSAELLALLDGLDAAREKATPGEWVHNPINGVHTPTGSCVATTWRHDDDERRADAALIVAAVSNLPKLTAALRAALAYADDMDAQLAARGVTFDRAVRPGEPLRACITAALTPEQAPS